MSVIPHVRICAGGTRRRVSLPRLLKSSNDSHFRQTSIDSSKRLAVLRLELMSLIPELAAIPNASVFSNTQVSNSSLSPIENPLRKGPR